MGPGFLIDDYADSSSTVLDQSGSACKGEAWMMRAFILLTSRMSGESRSPCHTILPPPPPTPPRLFPSELLQSKPSLQQGPGVHAHSILLISRFLSVYERNSRPFPVNGFATIQPIRKSPRSHSTNDWRGTKQNIDSSVRTIWCSNSAGATLPFWATGV
ncbi:hypothetical protein BO83DRAFT_403492 [Aspergillus eucalypticola CBS 122712]|uniref:Uncharacterized protein n=1 Tax=Aspergillus eucalypticola (strain CBS 122712 / IBT 29274) TaxID=1448314 RepID=A0A317USA4_ASPEC|nr:uncharacterized protein BO83DRAFT_403492 [Aspergillus eucalypticola CBS 122712]PWY62940.1 hypothetical protein BO83DRAFT_403492 [Aspergillus eucalypticola CBS 122712]